MCVLILSKTHQDRFLPGDELVAPHAIVFLDHPPAFLNVVAVVAGFVLVAGGQGSFLATHEEGCDVEHLILGEVHVWHA